MSSPENDPISEHATAAERYPLLLSPAAKSQPPPGRVERWAGNIQERWEDRPSIMEVHFLYLPMALMAGAIALGTVDGTLHTHLAERMARVKVDKKDNWAERSFEKAIHELGVQAVQAEK